MDKTELPIVPGQIWKITETTFYHYPGAYLLIWKDLNRSYKIQSGVIVKITSDMDNYYEVIVDNKIYTISGQWIRSICTLI